VVQALLDRHAAVNAKTGFGSDTALALASSKGCVDLVRALIAGGADVNSAVDMNLTALIIACRERHADVVRALFAAGADLSGRNSIAAIEAAAGNTARVSS